MSVLVQKHSITIRNALASLAVRDIAPARDSYQKLLEQDGLMPMPEVVEWTLPGGGGLQVCALAQRAGHGSCTLAVDDIEAMVLTLRELDIDTSQRTSSDRMKTVMVTDPDGNYIAFEQAIDPLLAR